MYKLFLMLVSVVLWTIAVQAQHIDENPKGDIAGGECGNAQEYERIFTALVKKGFRPVRVFASPSVKNASVLIYTAIFKKIPNPTPWASAHALNT